jgi:hypothetical protein
VAEHVTVRGGSAAVAHSGGRGGGVVLDAALERLLSTKAARRFLTPQLLARVGRCVRAGVCHMVGGNVVLSDAADAFHAMRPFRR